MTPYNPPVRELRFVIEELIGLSRLADLEGLEETSSDLVEAVLEEAGRLASEGWAPHNMAGDKHGCHLEGDRVVVPDEFKSAYDSFVESGWNGITSEPEWGGQALPELLGTATTEMWNAANPSLALCPLLTAGATEALAQYGSAELQAQYLEKLVSGQWTGTMNLTESQAGSDLGGVACKAIPDGDAYRLHGQKIYITWGEHELAENIIHFVLARTPDAPAGNRGISMFLVPKYLPDADGNPGKRNDVKCVALEHKLGIHACPTCTLSFGEGEGAIGYLIGELGRGLNHMFTMMNDARHKVGVQSVGIADRAYQQARAFAADRVQGRLPGTQDPVAIIRHPDVRRMLMTMRAQTEATRALALLNAAEMDRARHGASESVRSAGQRRVDLYTPLVKAVASDWAIETTSIGIQVHGGMGYVEETGAAQHLRDVRIAPIYEGTNGIQAQDFTMRKVLKDEGEALGEVLDEAVMTAEDLQQTSEVAELGESLANAIDGLRESVRVLLRENRTDPMFALSAATPFMHQAAIVLGGWLMARAAGLALDKTRAEEADPFYTAKLATAGFYIKHVLPRADACQQAVTAGCDWLESLEDEHI